MTDQQIIARIEDVLDQIRPNIQMDGGDISFVKFQDNIVYVRLSGACVGCPAAAYTMKLGVEEAIKDRIPDVLEVVALED